MIYGMNHNKRFSDIFNSKDAFISFYNEYANLTNQSYANFPIEYLYFLLYGNYGNSTIANNDENKFRFKLMGIVFMYGPTWAKKLEIQKKLYALNDSEAVEGSRTINNHAYSPAEEESETTTVDNDTALTYINEQNAMIQKKSKVTALNDWYISLEDVTKDFIDKFKGLFLTIVNPELPLYYESEVENNGY